MNTTGSEPLEGTLIKAGRPSTYKSEMIETMLNAKDMGASDTKVMQILGICRDTFYRWIRENPEFKEAHEFGKVAEEVHWDEKTEYVIGHPKDFNGNLYALYMKKRFKSWRDSGTPEATTNNIQIGNLQINSISHMSSDQLEASIQDRLEALQVANPDMVEKLMAKKLDKESDV